MKRRTAAELEASRLRARRRRRILLGWPEERLDDPPRAYGVAKVRPPEVPVPAYDPDPLVDQAIAVLRPGERAELGSPFDSIALDLVGAFCLAAVAGEDPEGAVKAERARYRHDRATLVYGTSTVDGLSR